MPSSDPIQRFQDILENILRIENYTSKIGPSEFVQDNKTYDAVERCLQRISEASKKIGDEAEQLCPGVPWAQLRGLGNFLRHEYDRVDPDRVWLMIDRDINHLKMAVEKALLRLRNQEQRS